MSRGASSASSGDTPPSVSPIIFSAMQRVDVDVLFALHQRSPEGGSAHDADSSGQTHAAASSVDGLIRPVLASLVRMSLIASLDTSPLCSRGRSTVLQILSRIELVNNLVALLSIDFHALETDVKREMQLRAGLAEEAEDKHASVLVPHSSMNLGVALEFERSDATRRLRLVLAELIGIMGQLQQLQSQRDEAAQVGPASALATPTPIPIVQQQSELFDHMVYLSEVCDVLCIAMAELPGLLSPPEVAEALLRLKYGPNMICHIVANQAETFNDVIFHLLKNGDKQDVDDANNQIRQHAILLLCRMNPSILATVRSRCVEWCRMPSLALLLTLEMRRHNNASAGGGDDDDLVGIMSGLLLGSDAQTRSWISIFVRNAQKRRNEAMVGYRAALLDRLKGILSSAQQQMRQEDVVRAAALIRLYTALRGIGSMKFSDDEVSHLFALITSRQAPATPAGVKFVSLCLGMLIACHSSLLPPPPSSSASTALAASSHALERQAVAWIQWLVHEHDYFEERSGVQASFGEMLLLMAIHFHSHQLNAIIELVCQTLGMKIAIRTSGMNRLKTIFTQEIFTEQVVAAHAVRVPVTPNLSSQMAGFLPIHCIHQLMKSRTFSKHKVPIKDWIYRQICVSTTPLHPVLPTLIEVFVNSILVPASNRGVVDQTNEPITEQEIKAVFQNPIVADESPSSSSSGRATPLAIGSAHTSPASRGGADADESASRFGHATQILVLYYILLYENVRQSHMRTILATQRSVTRYSHELLARLPVKYLLQTAERRQEYFGGVFPQLLRLCSTHYPHLCLVQDWLVDEASSKDHVVALAGAGAGSDADVSVADVKEAFATLRTCPSKLMLALRRLLARPSDGKLWKFAEVCVLRNIRCMVEKGTPRQIIDLYKRLWLELNKIFPRQLWLMTVHGLQVQGQGQGQRPPPRMTTSRLSQDDLVLDPLQVLRVDKRVFRCGPILELLLYVLKACLAASRTHLAQHILDNPIIERGGQQVTMAGQQVSNDHEREELKNALVATQESAAAQILLEAGLPTNDGDDDGEDRSSSRLLSSPAAAKDEDDDDEQESSLLTNVKEVQSIICSYLHEAFIADPNLAKLVHFQGYPLSLLPVTVPGVPSMHICLDFVPELLSQPDLEKQVFAVDLISHLSIQYALPKSYSTARLAVNVLSTLLSVITVEERNQLFPPVLPSLVRFCKAFPPLVEDVISLLLQYGKICVSELCLQGYCSPKNSYDFAADLEGLHVGDGGGAVERGSGSARKREIGHMLGSLPAEAPITAKIQATFAAILQNSLLEKNTF